MTFFSIKEASERLGCPPSTIRYYEKEGLLPNLKRDRHGNRMFENKDLDWMRLMTCLRDTGMHVADMKRIVELGLQGDETVSLRRAIFESHKEELLKRQKELDLAFEAVNKKLIKYDEIEKGAINPGQEFKMEDDIVKP
ncbi:MerR family transcriptional regulator [Paenibacillus sp. Y412MC10]|uniref:MerR family transcriptional regulator n=1 Tax=Geobacillus sp. (strain Y412MC10) TaxID=481743 RepID=UPI0011AB59E9|nr:MerR family transcriptional regulator [Paenibacillus sp. Y412MC10]